MLTTQERNEIIDAYMHDNDCSIHDMCKAIERAVLAKAMTIPKQEPVAEVRSKYGDPEAFGERHLHVFVDLKGLKYGTKLYAELQPAQAIPEVWKEEWKSNVMRLWSCARKHDSSIPDDQLDFMRDMLLSASPKP